MSIEVFVIMGVILLPVIFTLLFVWSYNRRRNKKSTATQRLVTDREILQLIAVQPDGMLSPDQLMNSKGLSKAEARVRLSLLREFGALNAHYTSGFKYYYSLTGPLDERPAPKLTSEPFLTVEDIITLFKHFNFRITPQQMIMATGLPVTILKREMKYFRQQKILQSLIQTTPGGGIGPKSFVLMEPYRSAPERFLEQQLDLNRQMETILKREDLV